MKTGKPTLALLILLLITGCSKETLEIALQAGLDEEKSYSIQDINFAVANPHATTYYKLLKTAILATNSNLPQTRSGSTDRISENPFVEKLENLDVSDENGDSISFFSMNEEEQQVNLPSARITVSTEDKISTGILKSSLQHYARRGDFIAALPKHNIPWIFMNIGDTWRTQLHGGVKNETLDYWNVKSYIMGIQVSPSALYSIAALMFVKKVN